MNKEVISQKQGIALIVFTMFGSTSLLRTIMDFGKDAWLSVIMAGLIGIMFQFIYSKLINKFPNKDFYEILEILFGKYIGKFFILAYILFFFNISVLVLRQFSEFISTVSLFGTPQIVLMIFMTILSIWVIKEGIEVLGRVSVFFMIILIVAVIFTTLLLIPNMEIKHIQPIFKFDINNIFKGAFHIFMFPFGELILFTTMFQSLKLNKSSSKVFIIGIVVSMALILNSTLVDILVLSSRISDEMYFPTYSAIARIDIGDFIQRLEIIDGIVIVVAGFIKLSVVLYAIVGGLSKLFNLNSRKSIITPLGILVVIFSYLSFENIQYMFDFMTNIFVYLAIPFQLVIPILTLIVMEVKNRKKGYKLTNK